MLMKTAAAEILSAHTAYSGLTRTAHRADFSHHEVRPGYLYVRSRAISSRCNDNYDEFPADEIEQSYRTFIGKPVFVNHVNENHRRARGVVIDAALHRDHNTDGTPDTWAEVLMEVDAKNFPKLAQAILAGKVYETSMGCDVDYSICSACGNKATTPDEYCIHIPAMKGRPHTTVARTGARTTGPIREICHGLRFFENSLLVEAPADPTAQLLGVDASGLDKTATTRTAARERPALHPAEGAHCPNCGHTYGQNPVCAQCQRLRELRSAVDMYDDDLRGDSGHDMDWYEHTDGDIPTIHGTCKDCLRTAEIGGVTRHGEARDRPSAFAEPCPNAGTGYRHRTPSAHDMVDLAADRPFQRIDIGQTYTPLPRPGHADRLLSQNSRTAARGGKKHVRCDLGHRHWDPDHTGTAAGTLIVHNDSTGPRILLGRRASWTDHGGTWGIPGGALADGETPMEGGIRETREELGDDTPPLTHHHTHDDDHGGWGYHTHIATTPRRFLPRNTDGEHDQWRWFEPSQLRDLDLHPGFAASWPKLAPHVRASGAQEHTSARAEGPIRTESAFSSEDYHIQHRAPDAERGVPLHRLYSTDQVNAQAMIEHSHELGRDEHTGNAINAAAGNPNARIKIYRAVPPGVTSFNPRDWITLSPAYARMHAEGLGRSGGHVITTTAPARHIHTDGNDVSEWGYNGLPKNGRVHWAAPPPKYDPDYAGGAIALSPEDHAFVHDRTQPVAERAHHLMAAIPRRYPDAGIFDTGAIHDRQGFWTGKRQHADSDADEAAEAMSNNGVPATRYLMHSPEGTSSITGLSWAPHTPGREYPDSGWKDYTDHRFTDVDPETKMRRQAAHGGLQTTAMPPKYKTPAEHPFFTDHPVAAENVVAHWLQSTGEEKAQGMRWYSDAHLVAHALAHTYAGGDTGKAAGVLSAYSPRSAWAANMHNAARSLHRGTALGVGEGVSIMGLHHKAAERIMNGEHYNDVLKAPKTNAFAALIHHGGTDPDTGAPMPHVVIDRHALSVAAGHRLSEDDTKNFLSSSHPHYNHVAQTYQHAAAALSEHEGHTIAPHQVQAVTWLTRIRLNRADDLANGGAGGRGRATMQDNVIKRWREAHPELLPEGAGEDNMHLSARRATGMADDDRLYLRFGNWPHDERSTNNIHGYKEDGVSVYDLHHGRPVVPGDEVGYSADGNDTHEELQGRIDAWRRGNQTAHVVRGDMVGFGGDGEPLLRNVRHMHDWAPQRHHLEPAWDIDIARDDPDGHGWGTLGKTAYGETKAPAQVDTLRDDACDVCGNSEGWDGHYCPVCEYLAPPEIFRDPDTSVARTMGDEMRGGLGDAAGQTALGQGADAVPGGLDQSGQIGPDGQMLPPPGAEPAGGETEDPTDATADGEARTLGDGDQPTQMLPETEPGAVDPAADVLTCPACGYQVPAGAPVSAVTTDPNAPASAGPVAGDVCPNCGQAVLVSAAELEGAAPPPPVPAMDPAAAPVDTAQAGTGAEDPEAAGQQDAEPGQQDGQEPAPDDGAAPDEDPEKDKPRSPAVKRVSTGAKGRSRPPRP